MQPRRPKLSSTWKNNWRETHKRHASLIYQAPLFSSPENLHWTFFYSLAYNTIKAYSIMAFDKGANTWLDHTCAAPATRPAGLGLGKRPFKSLQKRCSLTRLTRDNSQGTSIESHEAWNYLNAAAVVVVPFGQNGHKHCVSSTRRRKSAEAPLWVATVEKKAPLS